MEGASLLSGVYYGRYEKIVHVAVAGGLTIVFFVFFGIGWAAIAAFVIGIAKEVRDAGRPNDHFDMYDMLANVIGIVAAVLVIGQFKLL